MSRSLNEVSRKKLQEKIKEHIHRIGLFKAETDRIDECILDCQIRMAKHVGGSSRGSLQEVRVVEEVMKEILMKYEKTAAAVFYVLSIHHPSVASDSPFIKDVIGVLATLATVENSNLSRFLGMSSMLGIVCKTIKCAEHFIRNNNSEGIDIHKVAAAIGMRIETRTWTICLEELRPFPGEFVDGDPQRKLNLPQPRLPDGSVPSGFIGYAINMIELDNRHLTFVTSRGHGLRETLFYCLLSHVQVYRTKGEMLDARPYITHGAFSLDGGLIKQSGYYSMAKRPDVEIMFPVVSPRTCQSSKSYESIEEEIRKLRWDRQNFGYDIRREEYLLEKQRRLLEEKEAKGVADAGETTDEEEDGGGLGGGGKSIAARGCNRPTRIRRKPMWMEAYV